MLGSILFLVAAGALSLYATGYIAELRARTMAPDSGTGLRSGYVAELERVLGPRGAGGALREYALTRTPRLLDATARYLATARQALGLYTDQSETRAQQQGAAELAAIYEKISSLHTNARDLDPSVLTGRLEATNDQLQALGGALRQTEIRQQFDGAQKLAELTRGTVLFSFVGSFVVLMIAALLIRVRVGDPLQQAIREMQDMAVVTESGQGADTKPWGLDRRDEIGELSRAVQRMRDAGRNAGLRTDFLTDGGPLQIQLSGPSGAVMDEMLEALREAARDLTDRGRGLDATREEAAQKAADEAARLAGCVGELSSSHHKIEELVSAQRKDLGLARKEFTDTVACVRETSDQMQARFDDTLAALRNQSDMLSTTTNGLKETASEANGRLTDMVSGLAQTKDAVGGVLTEVRNTADTARSAADALKDQFTAALDEIRTAFTHLNDGITTVQKETANLGPFIEGQRGKVDTIHGEISARLVAAADAIDATIGSLSSVQEAQDAKLIETQGDLRSFGETVAVGISQISRSLEQGHARVEGLGHDLEQMRVSIEAAQKAQGTEGGQAALDGLTAAAQAQKAELERLTTGLQTMQEALSEIQNRVEEARGKTDGQDSERTLTALGDLQARIDTLAKGLADGFSDVSERITVLPGLEEKITNIATQADGNATLEALGDKMDTVLMVLSGLSDTTAVISTLEDKLDAAMKAASSQSDPGARPAVTEVAGDLRGVLDTLAGKVDDLAGAIGEGLNEILGQVGRTGEDYGVTAAAVARQQTELRGSIDDVIKRLDALTMGFGASDGTEDQVSPEGVAAIKDGLGRIEAQTKSFGETLDMQLSRLEASTSGLTQAMGAGLTQTDQLADRIGSLESQSESLSEAVRETFGRVESRLAAVSASLEMPKAGSNGSIPIDDLRQCIEETLLPFANTTADGTADGDSAALLQDVVAKLGSLADKVGHQAANPQAVTDAVQALGGALNELRDDLTGRLEAMGADVADLKGRDGAGGAFDAEALATLSDRIGAEARNALSALSAAASNTEADSADAATTEPVIHSLSEFARILKEQGMIEPDKDSLPSATADIDAVTDVIDVLERRSALLARRIMEGAGDADQTADVGDLDPELAISRLQAASEKLGNIATAVAIASDAQRLHAAG